MSSSFVTNSNHLIDLNSGANTLSITGAVAITGNLSVTGNATLSGNILGDRIQNGTTSIDIQTANGNANISIGGISNIAVFATTGEYVNGLLSVTGNVTANNGMFTNIVNVASHTGTLVSVTGNITANNLAAVNLVINSIASDDSSFITIEDGVNVNGEISATGNITGGNINTGGTILGNYTFAQSGNTSAYATKRILQYVPGTGAVTYSNDIDASSIYITGYAIEIHVSPSALDDSGNGTIGTPVKTIARAKALLAQAFETSSAGQRKTIVLHPGDYAENVTIDTQFTVLTTHELVGKNTTLSGTLTVTTGCTIDGLKMNNLVISATSATGSVDLIGCTVTTAVTKTSSAYTVFRGCDISSATLSITGSGSTVLVGGNYFTLTVNNAAAGVLAKSVVSMGPVTLTAGTVQLADTLIYALANTGNAITQSVGSVITVNNCQTLIPDLTNVARNSFGGFYSILNAVYDKANSTFAGTSLNSILYSQYINADRLTIGELISATGNITGGNILTGGLISVAGNITAGNLDAVNLVINSIASDDSSFITVEDGVNVNGEISATGNITGGNVLTAGVGKTGIFVTGTIPVAAGVGAGARAFVTDADSITFGNLYVGGSGNAVPVYSNGTSWYVG